jgi:protocatechuate 3,4-dioxygenase beta subunit
LKRLLAVLFTVFAGLVLAILAQSSAQAADNWSITGTVTDEETTNPIVAVYVAVYTADENDYAGYAYTGQNGSYKTSSLPPGDYKVQFSSYGSDHVSEWYKDKTDFATATPVTITTGNVAANAELAEGLRITGTITDEKTSSSVPNVSVSVYRTDSQNSSVGYGNAGQDGTYTTSPLPPGDYKIQFSTYNSDYLSQWYDNKTDFASATVFSLSEDNTVANGRLSTGPRLTGKVVDKRTGNPIENARVYISSTNCWTSTNATTDDKGEFTTRGLPPGDYKVQFSGPEDSSYISQWFDNKADSYSATPITLTTADRAVNASLVLGSRIKGTVLLPDTQGANGANVYVYKADSGYSSATYAYVGQDGSFQTEGLAPGKYRVQFNAPYQSDYLSEWYNDKRNFSDATVVELSTPGTDLTLASATLDRGSRVTGTVTAAQGGQQLSNVWVYFGSKDGVTYSSARTGPDGTYQTYGALPPGQYRVYFSPDGRDYLSEYYNNKVDYYKADLVTLTLGTDKVVDAALDKASHLVGTVTDPQGNPVADVQVRAEANGYNSYSAWTDEDGNYDVGGLRAGPYSLRFTPDEPTELAPEWWNNQTDEDTADIINLGAQQTLTKDVRLELGAVITGTVRDEQNQPVEGVTVRASGTESETAVTGADGTYRLAGLEPGSYRVRFKRLDDFAGQWYDGSDTRENATLLTLAAGQAKNQIDASLRSVRTIGGTVTGPDSNPVSDARVEVYADGTVYMADRTSTDDQGTFRTRDLPAGDYYLYIRPSSPTELASQWYDGTSKRSTATPVTVSQGQPATITARLARGGEIKGTVTGQGGTPLAGAYVSAERNGDYRYAISDSQGKYTITGLTSGSYAVEFYASEHITEWYNNANSADTADPVAVTQGQSTSGINAQLTRGGSISGTVRNADGGSVSYTELALYRGREFVGWREAGSDGRYTFWNLPAGSYTLHVDGRGEWLGQWWNNKPDQASADPIPLGAGQSLTGKDFTLTRGASISGTVKDSNGQPVEGYVKLTDADGDYETDSWIDGEGAFRVSGLRAGTYYAQFRPSGTDWLSEWWQDKPDLNKATPITLTGGQARTGVDAVLSQASTIRGSMVDGQGRAVRGCVTVFTGTTDGWAGSSCTDISGKYVVGGLKAGNYQVRFEPNSDKFARQWWNGAPRRATATTIALGNASEAVADATLLAGGTLTGVVTDQNQTPVGGVQVRAYTTEYGYASAVTDGQGRYTIVGLDNDTYKVRALPGSSRLDLADEWYDNKSSYATANAVPVGNGATVSANFALEKGASISGTVSDEDGPVSGIGVDVFDLNGNKALTVWTNRRGEYTSTALEAGQYKVRFMPGYYGGDGLVEQWWNDKDTEAVANIIDLGTKQQKTGIDATLKAIGPGDTAPGTPTDVQVTPGDKQVTVRWKAPLDDGGLPITRYKVEGAPYGECVTLGNLLCTIEGLGNGESYTFTVKASNSVGLSPASTPSASVIPFGKPKPPTAVKATAGTEKATVSWTPGGDNGRAISGYTVTSSPGGKTCQTAATTCEVTGLTGGTSYTFTVKATNIAGNSADSAASNAVTPVANPAPPITPPPSENPQNPPPGGGPVTPGEGTQPASPAAPSAPGKIKAKSKSRKLTVTWSPVAGATKYQVRVNRGSKKGPWKTVKRPKYTSGKLKKGKYTVEVKAVGAGGGGPAKKVTVKVK